jgi:hypothetical protein
MAKYYSAGYMQHMLPGGEYTQSQAKVDKIVSDTTAKVSDAILQLSNPRSYYTSALAKMYGFNIFGTQAKSDFERPITPLDTGLTKLYKTVLKDLTQNHHTGEELQKSILYVSTLFTPNLTNMHFGARIPIQSSINILDQYINGTRNSISYDLETFGGDTVGEIPNRIWEYGYYDKEADKTVTRIIAPTHEYIDKFLNNIGTDGTNLSVNDSITYRAFARMGKTYIPPEHMDAFLRGEVSPDINFAENNEVFSDQDAIRGAKMYHRMRTEQEKNCSKS